MTRAYRRDTQHDYTAADEMFAELRKLKLSNTQIMKRISKATGISWGTLYAHYFTNKWRMDRSAEGPNPKWVEPKPVSYQEVLNKALQSLSNKYGITDWQSQEGQALLEQFAVRPPGRRENGWDDTTYAMGADL